MPYDVRIKFTAIEGDHISFWGEDSVLVDALDNAGAEKAAMDEISRQEQRADLQFSIVSVRTKDACFAGVG